MEHYRGTAHTRSDIECHLVWITRYRKKLPRAGVAIGLRQLVRDIGPELEVEIIEGHVGEDHVYPFVSCPPHVSASYPMRRIEGRSSRGPLQRLSHPNEECRGRHSWARGSFVATSGVVTCGAIMGPIRTQDREKEGGDFRADDE